MGLLPSDDRIHMVNFTANATDYGYQGLDHYVNKEEKNISDYWAEFSQDDIIFDYTIVRTIFVAIYTLIFILCFFGNLAVVLVVTLHWRMRSVTKFFLGNLAFANLCVGAFCVYQNLSTYLIDSWPFGVFLCKMYHFTNSLSHTASILILVVISVERYFVLLHPFKYRLVLTIGRLKMMILGVWTLSALLSSPRLYYIDIIQIPTSREEPTEIICAPIQSIYDSKTVDMINFILLFLMPLGIIIFMYSRIAVYLRQCEKLAMTLNPPRIAVPSDLSLAQAKIHGNLTSKLKGLVSSRNGRENHSNIELSIISSTSTDPQIMGSLPTLNTVKDLNVGDDKRNQWKLRVKFRTDFTRISTKSSSCSSNNIYTGAVSKSFECIPVQKGQESDCMDFKGRIYSEKNKCHREEQKIPRNFGLKRKLSQVKKRTRQTAVRMLIVIVLTFALCNFPYHLRKMFQHYWVGYDLQSDGSHVFSLITFMLMYLNCAMNPILYAFMSKSFRASFKDLVFCRWRREVIPRLS